MWESLGGRGDNDVTSMGPFHGFYKDKHGVFTRNYMLAFPELHYLRAICRRACGEGGNYVENRIIRHVEGL